MSDIKLLADARTDRLRDVVLVHGLNGDPSDVWRNSRHELWPSWLADDHDGVAIWSLEYEAQASRWGRGRAMALYDRAMNLLAQMQARNLGARPIVFVAHSMGGLMVKQMLRVAVAIPRFADISSSTVGVAFMATPHSGSSLADVADRFRRVYRTTPAIGDLRRNSPHLRDLSVWYRKYALEAGIEHVLLREAHTSAGGVLVVDAESAESHISELPCIAVDADQAVSQ